MLSIDQVLAVIWRRRPTFLVTFIAVLGAVALVTFSLPKVYETTAYLIVNSTKKGASDFEQTQTNQVLTRTYAELLQTRNVANDVAAQLPFRKSGQELQSAVSVDAVTQTQLLSITAEGSSPRQAQTIANAFARVFASEAATLAGQQGNFSNVAVAKPAAYISSPSRPKPKLYLLIGAFLAALLATGAALLRHRLDQRLEIDDTSTDVLGLPILARIPAQSASRMSAFVRGDDGGDQGSRVLEEAYRFVVANLSFAALGQRPATLGVVSAIEREGKSTTTLSIARAAAETGSRVAVVDADLRRPTLSGMFEIERSVTPGLSGFLVDAGSLSMSDLTVDVPGEDVGLIPSGMIPPNPVALLGSSGLAQFVERAQKVFDLVVFDTPPISVGADASLIAARLEGVILVIDTQRAKRTVMAQAVEQLRRTQANVLGVVLTRTSDSMRDTYYYTDEGRPGDGAPTASQSDVDGGGRLAPERAGG